MPDAFLNHVPGMAAAAPVPILDAAGLSERDFLDVYVAASSPCLIKGAVAHWPARHKWRDRDYLKKICGLNAVSFCPHENHITNSRVSPGKVSLPYAQAIDRLYDEPVAAIECNAGTAEMAGDLGGFSFFGKAEHGLVYDAVRYFLFRNAGSAWHYHPFDETLMCQLIGTKKVGLLRVESPHYQSVCRIFFQEDYYEDPSAFEPLRDADLQWFFASLDEGDALYIPPLWWHGVIATSDRVGVTAPVGWRSPAPVIADALRKMASGRFNLMGSFSMNQFQRILAAARMMDMERELEIAWKRGLAQGLIHDDP